MMQSHRYCLAFSTFIRGHWGEVKAFTRTQSFQRRQVIYSTGDPADALYLIESGQTKVVQFSAEGSEKIIGIYQKGDLFGELCLCKAGTHDNQAVALEPTSVTFFSVKGLLNLLTERSDSILDLLMVFCARLGECQEQIASLSFDEVRERLAKQTLGLASPASTRRKKGGLQLAVRLTHEEWAQLVNTTRENVSRILKEFRLQGLLEYTRHSVLVFPQRVGNYLANLKKKPPSYTGGARRV